MNKIIVFYVKGEPYNKMYKFNSVEHLKDALRTHGHVPGDNEIVTEAYIDDNLVDMGNTFKETIKKLDLVLGLFN